MAIDPLEVSGVVVMMVMSQWVRFEAAAPFWSSLGLDRSVRGVEPVCRSLPQSQWFLEWSKVVMLDGATRRRNSSAMKQVNPMKGSSVRKSNTVNKKNDKKPNLVSAWHRRYWFPNF